MELRIGRRLLVRLLPDEGVAPGSELPARAPSPAGEEGGRRVELLLSRGAFGSGEHETTASCLELLETLPEVAGARVLDLGCGTGILAIAALKLGAAGALGVDIDPAATRLCRRNAAGNGLGRRLRCLTGTLADVPEQPFDLLLANLYGDLLLPLAGELVRRSRPGAVLLLSGILVGDDFDLRRRFQGLGCALEAQRILEEYCTLLFRIAR